MNPEVLRRQIKEVKELEASLAPTCTEFALESSKFAQDQNLEKLNAVNREMDILLKYNQEFETLKHRFSPLTLSKATFKTVAIEIPVPLFNPAVGGDQQFKLPVDQLKTLKENATILRDVVKKEEENK